MSRVECSSGTNNYHGELPPYRQARLAWQVKAGQGHIRTQIFNAIIRAGAVYIPPAHCRTSSLHGAMPFMGKSRFTGASDHRYHL
jgi:hypothetical protein